MTKHGLPFCQSVPKDGIFSFRKEVRRIIMKVRGRVIVFVVGRRGWWWWWMMLVVMLIRLWIAFIGIRVI